MTGFPITIYHNPGCGTSQKVLASIRAAGHAPDVVDYLKVGWTRAQIEDLLAAMGAKLRDILREKNTPARELGLLRADASDDQILDAMVAHPVLVERPIVATPKGVKLCRPPEIVLALLDGEPQQASAAR